MGESMCGYLEELARKLDALGHPLRLKIIGILAKEGRSMYLSEIASRLGVNRALAKIHLKKLERAGLVKSRVVLLEDEARALRFYDLVEFNLVVNPDKLKEVIDCEEG